MENYLENLSQIKRSMGKLGDEMPDTMKAFQQLHQAGASDGVLNAKTKELIALAIAVTVRCDGCIAFHVNDALEAGATREEIIEALSVSILMGGGPSLVYAIEAFNALNQFESEKPAG